MSSRRLFAQLYQSSPSPGSLDAVEPAGATGLAGCAESWVAAGDAAWGDGASVGDWADTVPRRRHERMRGKKRFMGCVGKDEDSARKRQACQPPTEKGRRSVAEKAVILIFRRNRSLLHVHMRYPFLFEVNARQWIAGLRDAFGPAVDLGSVPDGEIDRIAGYGVTHLWLMGVWPTGRISQAEALGYDDLIRSYEEALPGWRAADVMGSPYAIAEARVDEFLGGDDALRRLRGRLNQRGVMLILDFVPNHLGRDHPWVRAHPERFIGMDHPFEGSFSVETLQGTRFLAYGKDPFFDGWTDTVQVEYRSGEARQAMMEMLESISERCDGVRCDMAMLVLADVFQRTWGHVPACGACVGGEFWEEAIARVRRMHPKFLFLAEAYWGRENRLCELGFDFAYDKTLYDGLIHDDAVGTAAHILGMGGMNACRAHFLENHDEPRIASLMGLERMKAALLTTLGLPGMRFLHDGQVEGFRRFARIQLRRRADEKPDAAIRQIYDSVLSALSESSVGRARAQILLPRPAWDGNETHRTFVIVLWGDGNHRDLLVINLASHAAQCRVRLNLPDAVWVLRDRLGEEVWERSGSAMQSEGLYLDLVPRKAQIFALSPLAERLSGKP
jgi:glycosidase